MSAAARWSFTAKMTIWRFQSIDDWTGAIVYAAPVQFMGDYSAKAERLVSAEGNDFVSNQIIYTEYALATAKDFVLIGESVNPDPVAAGAKQIMLVLNYGDTLDRLAPDYKIIT